MTHRAISLMDVLVPPGNDWLRELCRRKTDLPAGVKIVRFSDADDDLGEDGEVAGAPRVPGSTPPPEGLAPAQAALIR